MPAPADGRVAEHTGRLSATHHAEVTLRVLVLRGELRARRHPGTGISSIRALAARHQISLLVSLPS
jgi:hypothetical protein